MTHTSGSGRGCGLTHTVSRALLAEAAEQLGRHVDRRGGPRACHPWQGQRHRGFTRLWLGGRIVSATHAAYLLAHNELPPKGAHIFRVCPSDDCHNGFHLSRVRPFAKARDRRAVAS